MRQNIFPSFSQKSSNWKDDIFNREDNKVVEHFTKEFSTLSTSWNLYVETGWLLKGMHLFSHKLWAG